MPRNHRTRGWSFACAGALVALVLAGCSSPPKADTAAPSTPTVLTLASSEGEHPDVGEFVAAVDRLSKGSMQIKVATDLHAGEVDYERAIIGDVRKGSYDLGQVGARAWDLVGVHGFRPLVAPFLITSHQQQAQVIASPVADEALASVKPLGLVGIALIPGELRHPIGITKPILRPADLKGLEVGIRPSQLTSDSFRALGAVPTEYPAGGPIIGFGAIELDLVHLDNNNYWDNNESKAVTTNLNLWPRMQTVVMHQAAYDKLTPAQRELLAQAGVAAAAPATTRLTTQEATATANLCQHDYPLLQAKASDLAAFEAAVAPLIATLKRDPAEAKQITAIRRLAADATATSATPTC